MCAAIFSSLSSSFATSADKDALWIRQAGTVYVSSTAGDARWSMNLGVGAVPMFSDKGLRLITARNDSVELVTWDLTTGKTTSAPLTAQPGLHQFETWLAKSSQYFFISKADANVGRITLAGDQVIQQEVFVVNASSHAYGAFSSAKSMSISPDGRWLAVGGELPTSAVSILDLNASRTYTLSQETEFDSFPAPYQISWSHDNRLAFAGTDSQAEIWQVHDHSPPIQQQKLGTARTACGVEWSPDGRWLAMGMEDGSIEIWEDPINGMADVRKLQHPDSLDQVNNLAFHMGKKMLVTCTISGLVMVWNLEVASGPPTARVLHGSPSPIPIVHFMPLTSSRKSAQLMTSSPDGSIRVWDPHADKVSGVDRLQGHSDHVYAVAYSPDGGLLASGSKDGSVRIWSSLNLSSDAMVLTGHSDWVLAVAWFPSPEPSQGRVIASGSADGSIRAWRISASASAAEELPVLLGHTDWVVALRWSPDGRFLASCSRDNTVRLWKPGRSSPVSVLEGHQGEVGGLSFSPDSTHLASASHDTTVRIWSLDDTDAQLSQVLDGHTGRVTAVAYSSDGTTLVSASHDRTVRVYQVGGSSGIAALRHTLSGHAGPVSAVAISSDSRLIASASLDKTIHLYTDYHNLVEILVGHTGVVCKLEFSPDSSLLASTTASVSNDRTVRVWDVSLAKELRPLQNVAMNGQVPEPSPHQTLREFGDSRLAALDFSPDGKYVAYGGKGYNVVVTRLLAVDDASSILGDLMVGNVTLTKEDVVTHGLPLEVLRTGSGNDP